MSNKPNTSITPEAVTDTVVSTTQQDVKGARPQPTTKAINAYGISVIRGGNVLGTPFLNSIIDAYTNLIAFQPIALVLCLVSTLFFLTQIVNIVDPFTAFQTNILKTHKNANTLTLKSITAFASFVNQFFVNYKFFFSLVFAMMFPYLSKPSSRNAIVAGTLIFYCTIVEHNSVAILALSHFFFLFVQLRNPMHKTIILLLTVLTVLIGHEMLVNLAKIK